MAGAILKRRELYIDVAVKGEQADEIFLYQVDFYGDYTFRTKEFLYKKEELEIKETAVVGEAAVAAEEDPYIPPEPLDLFREQWGMFCQTEVPTEVYATDAVSVMAYIMEPLMKKYPNFTVVPNVQRGREVMHDCVSMGRVISMSVFDEEQYLAADIRRRMKERYHDHVDEVKKERSGHIFIRQTLSENMAVLLLTITDEKFRTKKQVMLNRGMKEEIIAARFREILSQYPDADVFVDAVTPEFYHLFRSINQSMNQETPRALFSLESMLAALGKAPDEKDMVKTYLLYVKNQEEMRFGTFLPERLYSMHSFYLPVRLSGEKAWKKQFEKNTIWMQDGKDQYYITAEGDFKGKYIIKAGKEQFVLKLHKVSIKRYLEEYAVLCVEVENYCYPGKNDKERINVLASGLYAGSKEAVEVMELKLKDGKQAYSLTAVPREGNENQLWLNGLLKLGDTRKKEKKPLMLTAIREQMYCIENSGVEEEERLIQVAVIKDGVFRRMEHSLAEEVAPENGNHPTGSLLKRQKRAVKELFEMYRYLVVCFGEECEATQKNTQKQIWKKAEDELETGEVTSRLDRKFGMFF